MRSYGARLAKLEKALLPQDNELHIQIVYFDDPGPDADARRQGVKRLTWGDTPPIARVAPGLIESLRDDDKAPQEDENMRHDRRLAKLEDKLFGAQKQALTMLTTDELRTFVLGFERLFTPGCDTTPEEEAVKVRWLALVNDCLHARPADPMRDKLAERLRPQPPPWRPDDTAATTTPADVAPAAAAPGEPTPPADPPPWDYQMAKWTYQDPPAGPALRKMRAMARAGAQADERRRKR